MKKSTLFLSVILFTMNGVALSAINQGYVKLDNLFGFYVEPVRNRCTSCPKPRCEKPRCYRDSCYQPHCRPVRYVCGEKRCQWPRVFSILDRYHIDPNTYYFKTAQRETLLDYAASEGTIRAMRILLKKYKMNITDKTLLAAIENNQRQSLRFLLEHGAVPTVAVLQYAYDTGKQWAIDMFARYKFVL